MAISITATSSVLVEEERTLFTITISSDEPIPEGGLVLTVSSDTVNAFGQFDVLAMQAENLQIIGVNDDTSGFRVRLNEQTGTITLPIFDTGRVGETYIDDIQDILDEIGQRIKVTPVGDETTQPTFDSLFGSLEGDAIEVSGSNQFIFADSSNDLIDAYVGSEGGNHVYASSGDDTFILGSGDRLFGGDGNDQFYAMNGGGNTITGGAGADQFWIATAEIPESANIITDFTSGEDILDIAGLGIGFDDLSLEFRLKTTK